MADAAEKPAETMTDDELHSRIEQESVTATGAPAAPPASEPEEYSITLETGQVYKGKTKDEVIQQLIKAQEHASRAIKAEKESKRELLDRITSSQQPKAETGYDHAHYLALLEKDGVAALQYAQKFVPENRQVYDTIQVMAEQMETNQFRLKCPDFPSADESAVNALMSRMRETNQPWTWRNLREAYLDLRDEGAIKPASPAAVPAQEPARPAVPPTVKGTSASPAPDAAVLERMSDRELEEYGRKHGWFVQ